MIWVFKGFVYFVILLIVNHFVPMHGFSGTWWAYVTGFSVGLFIPRLTDEIYEPVKADAWRNLIFSQDSSTHLCNPIYPTEQAARDDAEPTLAYIKSLPGDDYVQHHDGQWSEISNISHCMQIPAKP